MHPSRCLSLACLVLLPMLARADGFQPLQSIRAAAVAALGADVQAQASIDSQLRMPQCGQPLQAAVTAATTVAVRCADTPGWQIYVPVRVRREADVVVLTTPVRSDEPINAGQLAVQRRELGDDSGQVLADPSAATGRRLRRAMPAGTVLSETDLEQGEPLRRGDPVTLVSRAGGIEVRMSGRALGPAQVGGVVTVENLGSRRIIRGRLVAAGVVEVTL